MNDLNPNARLITHHTILSDPSINSAIALSFFASGMGAWVVYGSTEMGANPELSWLGVIGYSAASSLPALIICMIGPRVRKISGEKAFCTTDFGLVRYGRLMQFSIAAISVFYSKFEYHYFKKRPHCYILSPALSND